MRDHEIRDPIHAFIRLDSHERTVVDSFEFQRLRHIHQLGLSHLVYPGATHRRFEHCLGVMELAGHVYDVVTHPNNLHDRIRKVIPGEDQRRYWRRVLRMAALCHDVGHLPFSHAAEQELLPSGWDHERFSVAVILSDNMKKLWENMVPPLKPQDIAKLAVGPKKSKHLEAYGIGTQYTDWEALLSEIIVGDAFGVDRMDYLLRDSYHAGVPAGRVDHFRLIDTLRILPKTSGESQEPVLGVEEGGLRAAEALLVGRYFMYNQVYMHPVRRIYDIHLRDFLRAWLPAGKFSTDLNQHLALTDNEVIAGMYKAAAEPANPLHALSRRLVLREHYRQVYGRKAEDLKLNLEPGAAIAAALQEKYGPNNVYRDFYSKEEVAPHFPVLTRDGRIMSSLELSEMLEKIPLVSIDLVFVDRAHYDEARDWLGKERGNILKAAPAPKED